MTVFQQLNAVELAEALESMPDYPHSTGSLSQLDEASLRFAASSPEVRQAEREFSSARLAHMQSYQTGAGYSDEAWAGAMRAAMKLAAALRKESTS
jgi:hypothetical protein